MVTGHEAVGDARLDAATVTPADVRALVGAPAEVVFVLPPASAPAAPTLAEMALHADTVLQRDLELRFAADAHLYGRKIERARCFARVAAVGDAIVVYAGIEEEMLSLYGQARRAIESRFGVALVVRLNDNPWLDKGEDRRVYYTPSAGHGRRFAVHLVIATPVDPAP
jgi:hypothetical protein